VISFRKPAIAFREHAAQVEDRALLCPEFSGTDRFATEAPVANRGSRNTARAV